MEGVTGGSTQIPLGQQYLSLKLAFESSKYKKWKGPPEALPKFILGRNIIASNQHLTLSKH